MRESGEGGIAQAQALAEFFADCEAICVILGDNLIEYNVCQAVDNLRKQGKGAKIILKQVPDATGSPDPGRDTPGRGASGSSYSSL